MTKYYCIDEIVRANENKGGKFFSKDNMRFFRSRVLSNVYNGFAFVTSECGPSGQRAFTARVILPNGDIETIGKFNELTRAQAIKLAKSVPAEYVEVLQAAKDAFNNKRRSSNIRFLRAKKRRPFIEMMKNYDSQWFYESILGLIKKFN